MIGIIALDKYSSIAILPMLGLFKIIDMIKIQILEDVSFFLNDLSTSDSAKIFAHIESMKLGHTGVIRVKTLRGKIKELIVKQYRIVFFETDGTIYVINAFKKRSNKTPKRFIDTAEKIYKQINHYYE